MEIQGRLALSGHRRNQPRLALLVATLLVGLEVNADRVAPAYADGAFPAAQAVLLPLDRPHEIVLATTFGLLVTEDDGATWQYVCEAAAVFNGRLYGVGAPPEDRIYAVSDRGAPVTADGACAWSLGAGAIVDAQIVGDVFPDPSDAARVFALARPALESWDPPPLPTAVYRSGDGGLTYSGPLFVAPSGSELTGIEVAASPPHTVYATFYDHVGIHPRLARSDDGGDAWTTMDIEPGVGSAVPYLAAVDPADSQTLYLRITSVAGASDSFEGLAVTTDGGMTWSIPLLLPGAGAALVGFARRPDGTLFVVGSRAGPTANTSIPTLFRSDLGGKTFTAEPLPFHPVGLGQRDGILFVATNNFVDGYALASSGDGGQSWRPRLKFRDVAGIKACVFSSCQSACDFLAGETLWPPETCNRSVEVGGRDIGSLDGSALDAPSESLASGSGCGCGLGVGEGRNRLATIGVTACLFAWVLGRRRRWGSKRAPPVNEVSG